MHPSIFYFGIFSKFAILIQAKVKSALLVQLDFPNLAIDEEGNIGFWTIIYNQGFEVVINNRKYFAYSYFTQNGTDVTSFCFHTFWGWAHATGVNPSDWSCFIGARVDKDEMKKPKINTHKYNKKLIEK